MSPALVGRLEAAYGKVPADQFLRAADGRHLASAAERGLREIYSNDERFLAAAPLFGVRGINVI